MAGLCRRWRSSIWRRLLSVSARSNNPDLAVELSVREDGGKELTISADGLRGNFAVVEQIVSQVIALPRSDTMTSRSCPMNRRQQVCCHFRATFVY